ncbi:MAG: peptide deformylase [Paracoccaceae bacterium]|nr:peptide deformylase [Paracoccaceae bacterium]MDG1373450.1 peptide deformylase [Paracoccaceae bacterium]
MSDSAFLFWPDPRLKEFAAPVDKIDADVSATWERMLDAMYAMPGVGLAAPQIGVSRRIIVVDCEPDGKAPVRLANPELIEASAEMRDHEEASPNLPGVFAKVTRPNAVLVSYLDMGGVKTQRWFEGLWSTSVQHQIDHLNGELFIERLSRVKRRMVLDKYKKLRRKN